MKNVLFILGLLVSILLFAPEGGISGNDTSMSNTKEEVMKDRNTADIQHRLETLSNELHESNGLAPRRVLQTTSNTYEIRIWKNMEKTLQCMRLKGENQLNKVSMNLSTSQTTVLSTLICRMGHHVYTLRKLII